MLIRIILFLIFTYFGIKTYLLVSRYIRRRFSQHTFGRPEQHETVNEMVRDPVCGVYIPVQQTLTIVSNGVRVYFCSEECRRRFVDGGSDYKK